MITGQTFDLVSMREDETRIFEHIGRFTVEAAHIDQKLSVLLAWMTGAPEREAAQKIFEGEQVSVKLRLLKRALPDGWADKKRLVWAISEIQKYRNSLAHSTVQTLLTGGTGDVNFVKMREYQGGKIEPIDIAGLKTWETRASMLHLSLEMLTRCSSQTDKILEANLRDLIFEIMTAPSEDHMAAIDFILPPTK